MICLNDVLFQWKYDLVSFSTLREYNHVQLFGCFVFILYVFGQVYKKKQCYGCEHGFVHLADIAGSFVGSSVLDN